MKYALYGAGQLGERYYNLAKGEYDIACFIDSDSEKWGKSFMGLDIISPEEAAGRGLKIILSVSFKYHLEIIRRLSEVGIKEFYAPKSHGSAQMINIDLESYNDISEKPNKVCVFRHGNAGIASTALVKLNPFDDLEVVIVNCFHRDTEFYFHYLTSALIITHGFENIFEGKKKIWLWHGFTIKTIGYMNARKEERPISPGAHSIEDCGGSAVCSLSKLYSIFTGYCAQIDYEHFRVTGYPRNDMIFRSNGRMTLEKALGVIRQKYIVFYAPTYRAANYGYSQNGENIFIFDMPDYDNSKFDDYLRRNDILFLYKMHTLQRETEGFRETGNIRRITDDMLNSRDIDLYEILNGVDCLISDYSSLIIDFLLTDKPMIFTPTDLEEYADTRGLMLEPYDAWMPGDIALDYRHLERAVSEALFGEDKYKKDRERLKRITHKYTDGNSSKRVLALARSMLGIG